MSQPTSPHEQYPAIIRAAGPAAMAAYDQALARLRAAPDTPGPKTLAPVELRIIAAIHGHGAFPDPEHDDEE